jgi:hypothetical protein
VSPECLQAPPDCGRVPRSHNAARYRVKPPPALERPAPLLIVLDQRHENVELVTLRRPEGRAPQLLDLGERSILVFVGADRADLHDRATIKQADGGCLNRLIPNQVQCLSQRSISGLFFALIASSTILLIASARDGTSIWPRRQSSTIRKKDSDTRI